MRAACTLTDFVLCGAKVVTMVEMPAVSLFLLLSRFKKVVFRWGNVVTSLLLLGTPKNDDGPPRSVVGGASCAV